jgi:hypothetical protein
MGDGPTPRTAQVVQMLQTEAPRQVTLRLLAPQYYRRFIAGIEKPDSPGDVIGEVAQNASTTVASLTGGRWEMVTHPHGKILIGHLKVPIALAQRICNVSGHRSIFATALTKDTKPSVAWLPKHKNTSTEAYLRASMERAKAEKCALALRQGGSNNLGLIGGDPSKFAPSLRKSWEIFGTPKHWAHRDVQLFLENEGWKDLAVRSRIRRRGQSLWVFHAVAPPFQNERVDPVWQYVNHDGSCQITILLEGPRARKFAPATKVPAPRKRWIDSKFDPASHEATQPDPPSDDDIVPDDADFLNKDRIRSPRRDSAHAPSGKGSVPVVRQPEKIDPDLILYHRFSGWSIKDEGGTGDCGFRVAARCLAV